jgi:hypothetical protein
MTVPTRFIEREEFHRLLDQEGKTAAVFKLEAIQFDPPRPDGSHVEPYRDEIRSINVLLMNVVDPVIYRDGDGTVFFILNAFDDDTVMTYENFEDTHPIKGAWGYRLCPHYVTWSDKDYDLDECRYAFNHGEEK